ncbi:MAG: VPLPA-CTERM sorting domain-containing protein, partial [Pseudomonadota bacterium]
TTAYTNSSSYEWSLVFYDIDGISSDHQAYGPNRNETNYYDEVLFRTPGVVTVASDSVLNTSVTADGILVSAENQDSVAGQDGLTSLTPEQEQYTAIYTVTDTSTVLFDYLVQDGAFGSSRRNLLVDGGSLTLTDPVEVGVAPVPLPAGAPLLAAGLVALGWLRRRKA